MSPYGVIVADPPWTFGDRLTMSKVRRGAAAHYPVLDTDALCALPVPALAADDAVLLLWCPDALLADGLRVFAAWGFRHTQVWTWAKTTRAETRLEDDLPDDVALAFGMGRLARACSEHALVGVRGSPYRDLAVHDVRNVFPHPALRHSAKPETIQDALDRMFPTYRKLELFARRQRTGPWTCAGNEAPETRGMDIRDVLPLLTSRPRCNP